MKRARAFEKGTDQFVKLMSASAMTEALRHAFDYRCPEQGCDCKVHWRRETSVNENTEKRPATFVTNPKAKHAAGCFHDYERIAKENSEYTYYKDGALHVRINFAVGTAKSDLYPMREGYLTESFKQAAQSHKDLVPFSSLQDLLKFVEKNLGPLDREDLPDLYMHYQGRQALFEDKFIGSNNYAKLYESSLLPNGKKERPSAIVVIKPDHEIEANSHGKRRFACLPQSVIVNGRDQVIKPIIVCYDDNPTLAPQIEETTQRDMTIAMTTRPFSNGIIHGFKETPVYMNIQNDHQFAIVDDKYWKPSNYAYKQDFSRRQSDLFDGPAVTL